MLDLVCLLLLLPVAVVAYFLRPKPRSISKKHVLVTGGSLGIGRAVAVEAARRGANVTIVARNEDRLKEAVEEITKHLLNPAEQKVQYVSADISSKDVAGLTQQLEEAERRIGGQVYMLVNCAGTSVAGRFEDIPYEDFYRLMDINYFGSVNVTRALLPRMKSAGVGGCLVFVSSLAGLAGLYGYTAYSATKFALRGFSEALQMELKPFGIDVCVNFPPDTDTPGFAEEQKSKPEETRLLSEAAGLFQPDAVAKSIMDSALRGHFFSSNGLDGWMLSVVCAGMSDCAVAKLLVQVVCTGPLRLVAWCYRQYFNRIVEKCKRRKDAAADKS